MLKRCVRCVLLGIVALAGGERSWKYREGHLLATLDVLDGFDEQNQLIALRNASAIWLDIGLNTGSTPHPGQTFRSLGKNGFYLGFEPLLDKYAANMARGVKAIKREHLGHLVLPGASVNHGLILPFAVADNDNQMASLQVGDIDGCATLGAPVPSSELEGWDGVLHGIRAGCGTAKETRRVPTVTLHTILDEWLGGQEVEFMHVDVQGAELSVLKSAKDRISRIRRFAIEVNTGRCATLTRNAPSADATFAAIRTLGYEPEEAACSNDHPQYAGMKRGFEASQLKNLSGFKPSCKCEVDVFFVRDDIVDSWQTLKETTRSVRSGV